MFKHKFTFVPNLQDPSIIVFERLVARVLARFEDKHFKTSYNLTRCQTQLLKELADDTSITIKPTDKGGVIVILNTTIYRQVHSPNVCGKAKHDKG